MGRKAEEEKLRGNRAVTKKEDAERLEVRAASRVIGIPSIDAWLAGRGGLEPSDITLI
jgi:hypothetical protein